MRKYEIGEEILLNSTTQKVPAKVLEVLERGLVVYVPSTGQQLEVPYAVVLPRS